MRIEHLPEQGGSPRRLGRHVEHDPRSLRYAHGVLPESAVKPVQWRRRVPVFDQGQLGSCTGNAAAGVLATDSAAGPGVTTVTVNGTVRPVDETLAVDLYKLATSLDSVPGQYPPDDTGSSGLAVAKAAKQLGYIRGYGHALSPPGLLHALQTAPVIVGAPWFSGFDQPDQDGIVFPLGQIRGGHEFLVRGYEHGATEHDSYLLADNSWGTSWGVRGSFRFSVSTWRVLAANQGDITIPRL